MQINSRLLFGAILLFTFAICAAAQDKSAPTGSTPPRVLVIQREFIKPGKGGAAYGRFGGVALEAQRFPDSPNKGHFPSARLDPGQSYRHRMEFHFFTER